MGERVRVRGKVTYFPLALAILDEKTTLPIHLQAQPLEAKGPQENHEE
jgi:hypothetical protein